MYPALQSYFMSIDKPPVVLKRFYESSLSELYLKHLRSFVAVFNEQVQNIERSKAAVIEVRSCLDVVKSTIKERQKQIFLFIYLLLTYLSSYHEKATKRCTSSLRSCRPSVYHTKMVEFR